MKPEATFIHVRNEGATKIGYGRAGVKLAEAVAAQGVDLYNSIAVPQPRLEGKQSSRLAMMDGDRVGMTNVVAWMSTPGHASGWHKGQYPVIFTMFETTRLPEAYREHLHEFALIVVPSQQNVELFSQFHDNVKLAYLGVDPSEWFYVPRQAPTNEFRFLIAGTGERKGQQLAADAFRKVFKTWPKDGPVPKLIMKSPKGGDFYGERVEMVTGKLSDQAERDLYASCHVQLAPTKGEGFGLQPLQGMAQGMPVILTDAHGQAGFAHLGYGISASLEKASYFIYGEAGEWWLPSFNELCERMEYCYNNWDEAERVGKRAAVEVAANFTWDHTANQFLDAIGRDRLEQPYVGDGSWFSPERRLYPVRVLRKYTAEIAGSMHQWHPGVDYAELSDVKRILFELGDVLDPSCVEVGSEDSGLAPEQAETLGMYSARHEWCELCHQQLGTGVQKADVIMAQLEAEAAQAHA